MKFTGTDTYVATEDLMVAVNAAITLERPLLVKGEPGTGETVLAGEGAPHNILVNAFNIGRIKSDQIQRAYDGSGSNMSFAEFVAEAGKQIPIGRMGEAEECANLACFLCSEQGSYITGTSINVDGGLSPAL